MAIKVAAPLEYALLSQSNNIIQDFAKKGLRDMAVNKLLEHKLTTKNFKAGLSFDNSSDLRHGFRKLARLIKNLIIKKLTWLDTEILPTSWLQEGSTYSGGNLKIIVGKDRSVARYVRFINRQIMSVDIPIYLTVINETARSVTPLVGSSTATQTIEISTPAVNTTRGPSSREMYRLFMYLPETVKFLETLSRKAHFRNETYTAANRSISTARNPQQHS